MATTYNNQLSAAEQKLSASAQAGIQAAKNAYNAAKAKGDTAGMAAANAQANAIRSSNNLTTSTTGLNVVAKPTTTSSTSSTNKVSTSVPSTTTNSKANQYSNIVSSGGSSSSKPSSSSGASSSTINPNKITSYTPSSSPSSSSQYAPVGGTSGDFKVTGSASSSGSTSTGQLPTTGNIVQVAAGGNAPAGTKVGDIVRTAGGDYLVVAPGTTGATYNPTNGLWSVKVTNTSGVTTTPTATTQQPYTPKGTYLDQGVSQADKAKLEALQAYYESMKAQGASQAVLDNIHNQAQDIRASYGYSGGGDGSLYIPIEMPEDTLPQIGLPIYEPQVEQVQSLYDAAKQQALASLQSAYDQSRLELEKYQASLPAIYQQQANALAAQNAMQQQQYNEYAAQSGLNVGNSAQARLAMANQMQQNMGQIRTAEANATAEAQYQLTQLFTQYQNSIAEAIANNEYERAAALLAEYKERAQSVVSVAQNQANLDVTIAGFNRDTNQTNWQKQMALAEAMAAQGDFSGYRALGLSDDQINAMRRGWLAQNPEAAVNLGLAAYN